jgi:peptidoglycan/LPS O-acetylase OafA/YrhL
LRMMKYNLIEIINIITLVKVFSSTSWHLSDAFSEFNVVAWYLAITVQIYLIVWIALLFKSYFYHILLFVSLLAAISLFPSIKNMIPYGLFLPFWSHFSVGILLYYFLNNGLFIPLKTLKRYALIIFPTYIMISSLLIYYYFSPVLFSLICGIFLWFSFSVSNNVAETLLARFFVFIGSFSYSIFLLHIPLSQIISPVLRTVGVSQSILVSFILMPLILAISFMWYLFFERPGSFPRSLTAILNPIKTINVGARLIDNRINRVDYIYK